MRARTLPVLLLAVGIIVALPACDTLDLQPEQELPRENTFDTPSNAESVLLGAYSSLQFAGAYGGVGFLAADFSTTNATFGGSFTTWQNIRNYNVVATSGPTLTIWDDYYEAINAANEVIANVEGVENIDPGVAAQYEAEARFIRALSYHNLLRWYARPYDPNGDNSQLGVPLKLEPTEQASEELNIPRSTVDDVYQQINADLNAAEETFASQNLQDNDPGRADLGAVRGLQSRVALYQGRYGRAATKAGQVINSGVYTLLGNVEDIYGLENTDEDVFAIQNSTTDNSGTNDFPSSFYLPSEFGGRGDITAGGELLQQYTEDDARLQELIYRVQEGSRDFDVSAATCEGDTGPCWTHKYRSPNFADNIRVLRLAEMYLTRAEARARTGDEDGAVEDVNTIRNRAGLADSTASGQDLIDLIISERRKELAFEGDYRHDILRRGAPLTNRGQTAPETQRIFPINQTVIDNNPALQGQQNPGY